MRKLQKSSEISIKQLVKESFFDEYVSVAEDEVKTVSLVLDSLNSQKSEPAKRVTHLIELLQMAIDVNSQHSKYTKFVTDINDLRTVLTDYVSRALSKYSWSPLVLRRDGKPPQMHVNFMIPRKPGERPEMVTEHLAVHWIVRHVNELNRLRRCDLSQCEKWYWAKVDHQKHCSFKCQQRNAAQSDLFKINRRNYMRHYRAEQKEMDAKALRTAKIGRAK